jgi:hypothetical protein
MTGNGGGWKGMAIREASRLVVREMQGRKANVATRLCLSSNIV